MADVTKADREAAADVVAARRSDVSWLRDELRDWIGGATALTIDSEWRDDAVRIALALATAREQGRAEGIEAAAKVCGAFVASQEDLAAAGLNGLEYPVREYQHAAKQLARAENAIRALSRDGGR